MLVHFLQENIRYLEEYVEEWKLSRNLAVFKLITPIGMPSYLSLSFNGELLPPIMCLSSNFLSYIMLRRLILSTSLLDLPAFGK